MQVHELISRLQQEHPFKEVKVKADLTIYDTEDGESQHASVSGLVSGLHSTIHAIELEVER